MDTPFYKVVKRLCEESELSRTFKQRPEDAILRVFLSDKQIAALKSKDQTLINEELAIEAKICGQGVKHVIVVNDTWQEK